MSDPRMRRSQSVRKSAGDARSGDRQRGGITGLRQRGLGDRLGNGFALLHLNGLVGVTVIEHEGHLKGLGVGVEVSHVLAMEAKEYLLERFSAPYEDVDIVIGYRAGVSYFSFAQDFLNGTIHYRQLQQAMHLGKLGQQVVLKSERAFSQIAFLDALPTLSSAWFARKQQRDRPRASKSSA